MSESLKDIIYSRLPGRTARREYVEAVKFFKCDPKNPWNKEVKELYFNKYSYLFKRKDEKERWEQYQKNIESESTRVINELSQDGSLVLGTGEQAIALTTQSPVNPYELNRQIYDIYQSDLYIRQDKPFKDACGQRWSDFLEHIDYKGSYETASAYVDKNDVVFDIGAGYGVFTLLALIQGARGVHAFEPNPLAANIFEQNMFLNGVRKNKYSLNKMVLSNAAERKTLLWERDYPCSGKILFNPKGDKLPQDKSITNTYSTRLDTYIAEHNISRVDFLKISAPKHEIQVLEGAVNALCNHKPKISIEVGYDWKTEDAVIDFIEQIDPQYVCQKRMFKVQATIGDE